MGEGEVGAVLCVVGCLVPSLASATALVVQYPLWGTLTPYLGQMKTTGLSSAISQFFLLLQESTIPLLQLGGNFGLLLPWGGDPLLNPGHMPPAP